MHVHYNGDVLPTKMCGSTAAFPAFHDIVWHRTSTYICRPKTLVLVPFVSVSGGACVKRKTQTRHFLHYYIHHTGDIAIPRLGIVFQAFSQQIFSSPINIL